MLKSFRLNEMEMYIADNGTVTMQNLCNHFDVSISTVRQDVSRLVLKGAVKKVYGGVSSVRTNQMVPFEERKARNFNHKQAIGKKAADLLKNHDIVFIDSGTTTMHVIEHIPLEKKVTILTHSMSAIHAAIPHDHVELIVLPGKMDRKTNSFLTADLRYLEQYNITVALMAATGISASGDVTNSSIIEHEIKRKAVKKSERAYLLVDSSKFQRVALVTYAHLNQFTAVITDEGVSPDVSKLIHEAEIELQVSNI